jgi:hypothetical protein
MQVIVHANENGGVTVTYPSPEFLENNTIEDVLAKDCPNGAFIIDFSALPQGDDDKFFDAWELQGSNVIVNFEKAKAQKLREYNEYAVITAQKRQLNTLSGLPNIPDDATWLAKLASDREAISAATTTTELALIADPK